MKKLLFAISLFLLPAVASSQESYTLPVTAQVQQEVADIATAKNEQTCLQLLGVISCTQAQACTAPGIVCAGGSSCSAAQARACNARIWITNTQAGREEFARFAVAEPTFIAMRDALAPWYMARSCIAWQTMTVPQRQSACTALQQPNPAGSHCRLCQ